MNKTDWIELRSMEDKVKWEDLINQISRNNFDKIDWSLVYEITFQDPRIIVNRHIIIESYLFSQDPVI